MLNIKVKSGWVWLRDYMNDKKRSRSSECRWLSWPPPGIREPTVLQGAQHRYVIVTRWEKDWDGTEGTWVHWVRMECLRLGQGSLGRGDGIWVGPRKTWASLLAQMVKNLPAMQDTGVQSLGREDPLEKEVATHSSILAWRIPRKEEPGRLQSMGSQRVGHYWAIHTHTQFMSFPKKIRYSVWSSKKYDQ